MRQVATWYSKHAHGIAHLATLVDYIHEGFYAADVNMVVKQAVLLERSTYDRTVCYLKNLFNSLGFATSICKYRSVWQHILHRFKDRHVGRRSGGDS